MHLQARHFIAACSLGLLAGGLLSLQGCTEYPPDLIGQCGLSCPAEGIAAGNASISGVVSIDAFFSAVIVVRDASTVTSASMRAEFEGIAASLEIQGYDDMELDDLGAAIVVGLESKFDDYLQDGLEIVFEPSKCEANVELAIQSGTECDPEAHLGSIEATTKCQGKCEVAADVAAECGPIGSLECTGAAPDFNCQGACKGICQLEGGLQGGKSCSGTCAGQCDGACSNCIGGSCDVQANVTMNCNGSCMGLCTGTCETQTAASCYGRCEGSCTYTPALGDGCEPGATAKCDLSAMPEVECSGKCEGEVTLSIFSVRPECQVSVDAKTNTEVLCNTPGLDARFAFEADLDPDQQAEFEIWLEGFEVRFAAIVAATARLENLGYAAQSLIDASTDILPEAIDDLRESSPSLKISTGLDCAAYEVEAVDDVLAGSMIDIQASMSAFAAIAQSTNPSE